MTGNLALDLLISFGGVALIVAVSALLGGLRSARLDAAAARARLAEDEPDFRPAAILVGADGRSAVAVAEGGEAAALFAVGDRIATRRFRIGAFEARAQGTEIEILLKDPSKWRLKLAAPTAAEAAEWAGRLSGRVVN